MCIFLCRVHQYSCIWWMERWGITGRNPETFCGNFLRVYDHTYDRYFVHALWIIYIYKNFHAHKKFFWRVYCVLLNIVTILYIIVLWRTIFLHMPRYAIFSTCTNYYLKPFHLYKVNMLPSRLLEYGREQSGCISR